jgi:hypothetical protein
LAAGENATLCIQYRRPVRFWRDEHDNFRMGLKRRGWRGAFIAQYLLPVWSISHLNDNSAARDVDPYQIEQCQEYVFSLSICKFYKI